MTFSAERGALLAEKETLLAQLEEVWAWAWGHGHGGMGMRAWARARGMGISPRHLYHLCIRLTHAMPRVQVRRTPEASEWSALQAQLARAREEREAGREQLTSLSEQLSETLAKEAALRADLAALQDDQTNTTRPPPPPPPPADGAGGGEEAEAGGAKKSHKGWGDRVKEMKERAEKAKANLKR